ncbi:MAG TPA: DUF1552 domain-containing protein [Planctomycetota bacterium]|nr:DUF1552 domain-containing protein [Planctomycetota bacterium]
MLRSRRSVLRGLGACVALPWLESLAWAEDPAAPVKPPVRLGFFSVPSGIHMADWTPTSGSLDALPWILEPAQRHARALMPITGLRHIHGEANGDGPGDHARETGVFLTGAQIRKTQGTDIRCGVSADQVAAAQIGRHTALPSLELGIEGGGNNGDCDSGYSCAYTSNISWRTPTMPMAKECDPRAVFERLFVDPLARGGERAIASRRSVLDLVLADARLLSGELGGSDRRKLDEYLDSVRALETRIERRAADRAAIPDLALPEKPKDFPEHVRLMFDLIALAFQTDRTRVVSFMFGNGGSNRSYEHLGLAGGHHELSHHARDPVKVAQIRAINRHHVELFAHLLDRLAAVPEGDGTLLDHCLLMYGSGISDGDRHNHDDLPILLAGRGASVRSGRHLRHDGRVCDLLAGMLGRAGVTADGFGDSEGRPLDL